jgi:hypothetical protein
LVKTGNLPTISLTVADTTPLRKAAGIRTILKMMIQDFAGRNLLRTK